MLSPYAMHYLIPLNTETILVIHQKTGKREKDSGRELVISEAQKRCLKPQPRPSCTPRLSYE